MELCDTFCTISIGNQGFEKTSFDSLSGQISFGILSPSLEKLYIDGLQVEINRRGNLQESVYS